MQEHLAMVIDFVIELGSQTNIVSANPQFIPYNVWSLSSLKDVEVSEISTWQKV